MMNISPTKIGTIRSIRSSYPSPQASVSPRARTETTGQIQRVIPTRAELMFPLLGSAFSAKYSSRLIPAISAGRPKTAKARLEKPSGSPLTFQCVTIVSGSLS